MIQYYEEVEALRNILAALPRQAEAEVGGDAALTLAWTLAAGPRLAARARCLELKAGVLHLELATSSDASARSQIESVRTELLEALRRSLGTNRIHKLLLH